MVTYQNAKRIIDVVFSAVGLTLLAPLLLIIAVVIKLTSPGPVFFRQDRAGLYGEPFTIYKFRSMFVGSEKNTLGKYIRKESVDLTRIGIFLRRWGLDELPQLWNVLRGEMSLVGPRPTLIYQVEKYDDQQRKRLQVKPGLTGWAQVNGNNLLEWPEKITYDLWYVDNSCIWLDIKIILKTIPTLIRGDFPFPGEEMEEDYIAKR